MFMNKRLIAATVSSFLAAVQTAGCGSSTHAVSNPSPGSQGVSYDAPHDIFVLSDPPGARIVVDAETLSVPAPLTVRHTRKRQFGVPDGVSIHALGFAPGQCTQRRLIPYDRPLPDSIVFSMTRCPNPDQDYARVFALEELSDPPERLGGPMPQYPLHLQAAHRGGLVLMEVVLDTAGVPEPHSFRVLVATDSGFIQSARAALLGSVFKPGRFTGRKVRTLITLPIIYQVRLGR